MPISVNTQALIFIYSVIGGMLIAFIYDAFRIKRKAVKTRSIAIFIEDFIYWIIVALIMLTMIHYSNEGEIRGYIFLGTAVGVILYISLFSRVVIKISLQVIEIICRIFRIIWRVLSFPFKLVIKIISIPCKYAEKGIRKAAGSARRAGRNRLAKVSMWRRVIKNFRKKI